ncbi:chitin synthesis regulation, resistance to congo red-domain-containing protein [Aspergillus karnatakaensis]|uniref:resistance to Congo red protein n=1 Tax=Aspergillus karnatakaensis TaxID=1810916 RepID=UPI003CCDFD87
MPILYARDDCFFRNGVQYCDNRSSWHHWGRWVAFGVIVGVAVIIFFSIACFNARRRRSRGLRPYAGTAWMAPPPPYQQQAHRDPYNHPPPPPQYPGPQGYFGQQPQQSGIELQSPPHAYGGGYAPPPGPPPAHQNGKP